MIVILIVFATATVQPLPLLCQCVTVATTIVVVTTTIFTPTNPPLLSLLPSPLSTNKLKKQKMICDMDLRFGIQI